jgi:hypothetical protein
MPNPIKAVKAVSKLTAGKAKSTNKREIAKNKMSPQQSTSKAKLAKATSNKKVARAGVSANTASKGRVKEFIKDTKKTGKAYDQNLSNTRKSFPYYASDVPKVPVKRRGK